MTNNLHTIRNGENLTTIAKKYNTSVAELARINNISNTDLIFAGTDLKIKDEKSPTPTDSHKKLENELQKAQKQLDAITKELSSIKEQNKTNNTTVTTPEKDNLNAYEALGLGIGGYAVAKGAEKAYPYVKSAAETGYLKALYAKDNISKKLDVAKQQIKTGSESLANSAQERAASIKQGVKNAGERAKEIAKTTKEAATTTVKKGNKIMGLTKYGKAVSKRLPVVGWTVAAVETYQAGKDGGAKAAVEQGAKSLSGIAGGACGAKIGAFLGACTGPAAPVAAPVLAVVGGIAGYLAGEEAMEKLTSFFK